MAWEKQRSAIYEKWKGEWYRTHPREIAEYSWNYLFHGGKEIRARLFCELWHYLSPDSEVHAELAFSIECIHVASLIIDDCPYMDNADTRRGRETLHRKFSLKKALLICYDVMNMARTIWLQCRPQHVAPSVWHELMKSKLQRLMVGQWLDIEKTGTLFELASLKTGVLFELVTETVAICIDLDRNFWHHWGNHLGILFQWMDDWNDRKEDIEQQNRNAFNEDYEYTLSTYRILWRGIRRGIGEGWFIRPFGKYIHSYFTNNIPFLFEDSNQIQSLTESINTSMYIPEFDRTRFHHPNITNTFNGKDILSILFYASKYIKEDDRIKTDLWSIPEEEWLTIPEIEEWLEIIQERTGMNVRPEYEKLLSYVAQE